ncbi:MAG: TolC family protein [Brotaphodocola sp.]
MKANKKLMALFLAAGILTTSVYPMQALAAGPLADKVGEGYDEETWAKLTDDVLEYDEVPTLVHEFNTSISQVWDTLRDTQEDLKQGVADLESYQFKMEHLTDKAKSEGDYGGIVQYMMQDVVLSRYVIPAMRSASSSILSRGTSASLQKAENQITMAVQSLMITYDSTMKQRDVVEQLQKLYDRQYQLTLNQQNQGLATLQDVVTAQSNQISALSTLQTIDSGLMQMKPILCSLTGWPADADPVIGEVPPVDLSRIDGMNLEEDTRKAIGNNSELISQRTSEAGKTMAGVAARLAVLDEGDQKMTIKMQSLYDDVFAKKSAYEGAKAGFEAAQKQAASYARMYEIGMLSEADYLGTQISYYQKKASYVSADTALRLAIETYGWAVKGLVNAD